MIQSIDVLLFTIKDEQLQLALLKRNHEPFKGEYALPGGYVHEEEDNDCYDTAYRVIQAKTGIKPPYLEQLQTFSGANRDPRGWSISVAYFALVPLEIMIDDCLPGVKFFPVGQLKDLPFDHKEIVEVGLKRVRSKSLYSSLPCYLAGEEFTIPQLQKIYEICLGEKLNKVGFRRKLDDLGCIEEVPNKMTSTGPNRPSKTYRLTDDALKTISRNIKFTYIKS